jgi:tetratricopeptide (TPR) repeat protein
MLCHNQGDFAEKHHPENLDCTACHMARPPSNDIAHEQVTDHWIKKRIANNLLPTATSGELETVGGFPAGDRDLGLAYAQMVERGDQKAGLRAMELLHQAERTESGAHGDHELHSQLGFLEQLNGRPDQAAAEYRLALQADQYDSLAGGDLALIEAQQRHVSEAVELWRSVIEHDPSQAGAGMNLAIVECAEGNRSAALETLERLLGFAPDNTKARVFADRIRSGNEQCKGK